MVRKAFAFSAPWLGVKRAKTAILISWSTGNPGEVCWTTPDGFGPSGLAWRESPRWNRKIAPLARARQNPSRGQATLKDDRLYPHHMLERCRRITRFIAPGREAFMASDALQDAVIRNVEVIGEAAKRVSNETRSRMASLDWRSNSRLHRRRLGRGLECSSFWLRQFRCRIPRYIARGEA